MVDVWSSTPLPIILHERDTPAHHLVLLCNDINPFKRQNWLLISSPKSYHVLHPSDAYFFIATNSIHGAGNKKNARIGILIYCELLSHSSRNTHLLQYEINPFRIPKLTSNLLSQVTPFNTHLYIFILANFQYMLIITKQNAIIGILQDCEALSHSWRNAQLCNLCYVKFIQKYDPKSIIMDRGLQKHTLIR